MELKYILKTMWHYRIKIAVFSVVLSVLGLFISLNNPSLYRATIEIYVKRQTSPSDKFYSYDGYYSQQAAERYAQTVRGFIRSKEIVREVLSRLGESQTQESLQRVVRSIKVIEVAPQLLSVSVTASSGERAASLVSTIASTVPERLNKLNADGDPALSVSVTTEAPFIENVSLNKIFFPLIGFLLGAFIGILFVSFRVYLTG